ncbi:MAG: hypothetical protein K2J08_07330, partial [Ruminococcus sp.]|nr:hypothetical protein [Ruminococcus sp.]
MKTNSLKKAFTALAVSAVAVSSVSLSAFATANNGFTDEEIANSPLKPVVTIDRVELTWDEAQEHINNHTPVMVEFNLSGGMDGKYCATGMHVFFDNRLTHVLNKKGTPDVKRGDATELFDMARFDAYGDDCIFVATGSAENCGYDGLMYTFQFYIPDDAQPDDLYPIDVQYASTADAEDKFTDVADSDSAKLAQGYFFTKGIEEGGWIHIEDKEEETTTTTTPAPETTTTTTPAPATTTTTTTKAATTKNKKTKAAAPNSK